MYVHDCMNVRQVELLRESLSQMTQHTEIIESQMLEVISWPSGREYCSRLF